MRMLIRPRSSEHKTDQVRANLLTRWHNFSLRQCDGGRDEKAALGRLAERAYRDDHALIGIATLGLVAQVDEDAAGRHTSGACRSARAASNSGLTGYRTDNWQCGRTESDRELHGRAYGIILKDAALESLVKSLQQVADGQRLLPLPSSDQVSREQIAITENALTVLTDREHQIMCLVSEGLSNKEIGRRLNTSDGTIKVHLHHIYRKLEISNRTMLAALAISQNESSGPPRKNQVPRITGRTLATSRHSEVVKGDSLHHPQFPCAST